MKSKLLKSFALSALMAFGASAMAQETSVTTSTGDSWPRTDNAGAKNGGNNDIEIKTFTDTENGNAVKNFYGVMTFEFTRPEAGNEVKSATLRLTTRVPRGDRNMNVYALQGDFDADNINYNDVKDNIEAALLSEPIATFSINGQNNKALTDGGLSSDYLTVEAWQNTIDLTSYVRTLSGNKFAIVITKAADENQSSRIYSKDCTDLAWNADLEGVGGQAIAREDVIPQLTVEYQEATGQYASVLSPVADTYVRKGTTADNSAKTSMEIYTLKNDEKDLDFVGLMSFAVPQEVLDADNYEVKSATLRLVSKRVKGDRNMSIYSLGDAFEENAVYADMESLLAAARQTEPIAKFAAAGQGNKDFEIDAVGTDWRTADKWTNTIDLTEAVKALTSQTLSIAIAADANSDQAKMFFTKEAAGFTNEKDADNGAFSVEAADLVPQLTVVYLKKEGAGTSVNSVVAKPATETKVIFTLDGRRVTKMGKGVYIVNGKKVISR